MQRGITRLKALRQLIADEGLTIAILAAVAAATVIAFGFGAEADIVASMLVIGLVTRAGGDPPAIGKVAPAAVIGSGGDDREPGICL
ncbi:hypothetical protein ACVIHH_004158 [Bradyrhizobium sp. USDA 4518]